MTGRQNINVREWKQAKGGGHTYILPNFQFNISAFIINYIRFKVLNQLARHFCIPFEQPY